MSNSNPIADLSYRNYDGPLRPPVFRWWIIARQTMLAQSKNKWLWFMSLLCALYYLIMIAVLFVIDRLANNGTGGNGAVMQQAFMNGLRWKEQFLHGISFAQMPMMLISLVVGAGAIANDNRANALLVYLSKPCSRFDYAFGKWIGVFLVLFAALAVPSLTFFAYGALSYRDIGFFKQDPYLLLKLLAIFPLCAAFHSSLILAISSLFKQGRIAGAVYAGLYFLGEFFTKVMGIVWVIGARNNEAKGVVNMLYYCSIDGLQIGLAKAILRAKGSNLFGMTVMRGANFSPPAPPLVPCLLIVLVVTLASIGIAWKRVRAVEVVN